MRLPVFPSSGGTVQGTGDTHLPPAARSHAVAGSSEQLSLDELLGSERGAAALAPAIPRADSATPPLAIPTQTLEYAAREPQGDLVPLKQAWGGWWRDVGRSAAFPLRLHDLVTVLVVLFIVCLGDFIGMFGLCFALPGYLICTGWYYSFQLNAVSGAAGREEDLPALALTEGLVGDVIIPLFKMLAVWAVILLPPLVLIGLGLAAGLTASDLLEGADEGLVQLVFASAVSPFGLAAVVTLLMGLMFYPLLVLVVAVGGFAALLRVDLMLRTVLRVALPYLVLVGLVYLTYFAPMLVASTLENMIDGGVLQLVIINMVAVFLTVVTMRAIGLFYHHFKDRFAWSWG